MKATELRVVGSFAAVKKATAIVNGKKLKLKAVKTLAEFEKSTKPVYYIGEGVDYTRFFSSEIKDGDKPLQVKAANGINVKLPATDVTKNGLSLQLAVERGEVKTISARSAAAPAISLVAPANIKVDEADRKPYSLKLNWDKVADAQAYEIEFNGMNYFDIRENEFLFEDLVPETEYSFKVRSTAIGKASEWKNFSVKTNNDPYEFAIKGMTATCTAPSQGGENLTKLFDFDAETGWHTAYGQKAVPFELTIDMHSVNTLDRMQYQPRKAGYNGIILEGSVSISMDKETWKDAGTFKWNRDAELKEIVFKGNPEARYVRLNVTKAYGDYGSGNQIYIFRVAGSTFYVPGDINNDGILDDNDLTSFMNYTGLRQGDSDFEGYVSKGDINGNGLIDAYDISNAAVEFGTKRFAKSGDGKLAGEISIETNKGSYKAGEEVVLTIKGKGLANVNAISFAIPYSENQLQYVGNEPVEAKGLNNFSRDRLHTNGQKAFYPTFVGVDNRKPVEGDVVIATIRFKAKTGGALKLKATDIMLVDRQLYSLKQADTDCTVVK